ncbi:MAG TPA: FAD-dependent oxidoreductase [Povalibacter sp.]|uniref:FAD-dependent oxidoreductase n=1 Tax=Povalibacter sp. TaxID=1962978 RepID=UPI002BBA1CA6|nr:FAD-dependent oxidoreductase [Povalibacter sp.]HMN46844.1 FAD-dependent oxidoreductase [Povalibacter sp.]
MNETFDFVIVGSGGGSMCAALLLRAAGRSVVILEKSELVGGTTATSGGVMWIPDNRFMQSAGIRDSADDALNYLDAVAGEFPAPAGSTHERRRAYVEQAPQMLDFLVSQGIRLRRIPAWPDYYAAPGESVPGRCVVSELYDLNQLGDWKAKLRPGFLPLPMNLDEAMEMPLLKRASSAKKTMLRVVGRTLADRFRKRQRVATGQALQAQMLNAAVKAGADIRVNSAVTQLIVEGNRVTGVVTKKDGSEWRIGARLGVLVNAGGFARNQRMLDRHIPDTSADWSNVIAEDTGDLIEEGARIGAALAQMDERIGMPVAFPPGKPKATMGSDVAKPHCITVDQSGVRYMNEAGSSVEYCRRMLERNRQSPAVPSWMVFDSQYINTYMLAGSMAGPKKPQAWFDEKFLRKADTLDALATACSMDAATLRACVERFNEFARRGRDDDFHRGEHVYEQWQGDPLRESKSLGALEQGPFYAMQIFPGDVSTCGGLVTDTDARVLRPDGSVIEGLYATGTSTASVMGKVEPGAGGSVGPSFTWGYVAARHALAASATATASSTD